jgi:hypothetical protein
LRRYSSSAISLMLYFPRQVVQMQFRKGFSVYQIGFTFKPESRVGMAFFIGKNPSGNRG